MRVWGKQIVWQAAMVSVVGDARECVCVCFSEIAVGSGAAACGFGRTPMESYECVYRLGELREACHVWVDTASVLGALQSSELILCPYRGVAGFTHYMRHLFKKRLMCGCAFHGMH